jgi:hypothetical protein
MPSRPAVAKQWAAQNTKAIATGSNGTPDPAAFVDGDASAMAQVTTVGFPTVQAAFDQQVLGLATGGSNPKSMLDELQTNSDVLLQP